MKMQPPFSPMPFALIVAGDANSPTLPLIGKAKWPVRGEPLSAEMKQAIEAHLALNRQADQSVAPRRSIEEVPVSR